MHWVHNTCPSLLSLSPRGHSIQEDWSPPKIKRDAFASHMTVWGPLIASHYCKLLGPTSSSRLYSPRATRLVAPKMENLLSL